MRINRSCFFLILLMLVSSTCLKECQASDKINEIDALITQARNVDYSEKNFENTGKIDLMKGLDCLFFPFKNYRVKGHGLPGNISPSGLCRSKTAEALRYFRKAQLKGLPVSRWIKYAQLQSLMLAFHDFHHPRCPMHMPNIFNLLPVTGTLCQWIEESEYKNQAFITLFIKGIWASIDNHYEEAVYFLALALLRKDSKICRDLIADFSEKSGKNKR